MLLFQVQCPRWWLSRRSQALRSGGPDPAGGDQVLLVPHTRQAIWDCFLSVTPSAHFVMLPLARQGMSTTFSISAVMCLSGSLVN